MKKILSFIISLIICVSMVGCSSNNTKDEEEKPTTNTEDNKEEDTENNKDDEKEEYDSTKYEATVVCPKCGKNAGATEDGKVVCKYCNYEGKHKTQEDKQKKYKNKTYQDGYDDGYGVGFDYGISDGENNINERTLEREAYLNEKYESGYSDGYDAGYSDGYKIGMKRREKKESGEDYEPGFIKDGTGLGEKEWNKNDEPEEHPDSYYE